MSPEQSRGPPGSSWAALTSPGLNFLLHVGNPNDVHLTGLLRSWGAHPRGGPHSQPGTPAHLGEGKSGCSPHREASTCPRTSEVHTAEQLARECFQQSQRQGDTCVQPELRPLTASSLLAWLGHGKACSLGWPGPQSQSQEPHRPAEFQKQNCPLTQYNLCHQGNQKARKSAWKPSSHSTEKEKKRFLSLRLL